MEFQSAAVTVGDEAAAVLMVRCGVSAFINVVFRRNVEGSGSVTDLLQAEAQFGMGWGAFHSAELSVACNTSGAEMMRGAADLSELVDYTINQLGLRGRSDCELRVWVEALKALGINVLIDTTRVMMENTYLRSEASEQVASGTVSWRVRRERGENGVEQAA